MILTENLTKMYGDQTALDCLIPFLYNNQNFTQEDYAKLPNFNYVANAKSQGITILALFVISFLLFGSGFLISGRVKGTSIIQQG